MSYSLKRRANYYETDQMGMIHHSNYIRWVEEARIEYMRAIGCSYRAVEEQGVIIPVTDVRAKYHVSVKFDDDVVIEARITSCNGVRFALDYEVRFADTGVLAASLHTGHCFLSPSHEPMAIKHRYPELYERLSAAVEPAFEKAV